MTNQRAIETLATLLDWLVSDRTDRPDMADVSQAVGLACMALENERYYTPAAVAEKLAIESAYIAPPFDADKAAREIAAMPDSEFGRALAAILPDAPVIHPFCYRESRGWGRCEGQQCQDCAGL